MNKIKVVKIRVGLRIMIRLILGLFKELGLVKDIKNIYNVVG